MNLNYFIMLVTGDILASILKISHMIPDVQLQLDFIVIIISQKIHLEVSQLTPFPFEHFLHLQCCKVSA